MRFSLLPTLIFLCALNLGAQVNEELTVSLRDIRVHVTDAHGNPIQGLSLQDFVLKDNGLEREIDFFEEIQFKSGPQDGSGSIPQSKSVVGKKAFHQSHKGKERLMVLMVQSSNMTQNAFDKAVPALYDFIDHELEPQDRVKIVHMDAQFQHLTGFIKDKDLLKDALGKMVYKGRVYRELRRADNRIHDSIDIWLRTHPDARDGAGELVRQAIREKARLKKAHYETLQINLLELARVMEEMDGSKSLYLISGGSFLDVAGAGNTSNLSQSLGAAMNRADVTIYAMLYRPTSPGVQRPLPNAIEGAVGENDYDPRTWERLLRQDSNFPPNQGGYTATGSAGVTLNTAFENKHHLETGTAAAAETTGGLFQKYYNSDDMTGHMRKMREFSNHYYRLGYLLADGQTASKLNIALKEKGKGWKLRYGREYGPKTFFKDLSPEEQAMAIGARLRFSNRYRDDLNVALSQHVFKGATEGWRVPLMVELVADPFPEAGFSVNFAVLDEGRNLLDITSTVLNTPPNSHKGRPVNLQSLLKKKAPMGMYDILLSKETPRFVRCYVMNLDTGDVSFLEHQLHELPRSSAFASDILITTQKVGTVVALNHLRKLSMDPLPEDDLERIERDPFWLENRIFKPGLAREIHNDDPLWVYFHVSNSVKKLKSAKVKIFAKTGSDRIELPMKVVDQMKAEQGRHVYAEVDPKKLDPGSYQLTVQVKNSETGELETMAAPLAIASR